MYFTGKGTKSIRRYILFFYSRFVFLEINEPVQTIAVRTTSIKQKIDYNKLQISLVLSYSILVFFVAVVYEATT